MNKKPSRMGDEGFYDFLRVFSFAENSTDMAEVRSLRGLIPSIDLPIEFKLALDSHLHYLTMVMLSEEEKPEIEFVYAFGMDNGLVKIGRTKNKKDRLAQVQSCNGVQITASEFFKTPNAKGAERKAHAHFRNVRHHGEYFSVSFQEASEHLRGLCGADHEPRGVVS